MIADGVLPAKRELLLAQNLEHCREGREDVDEVEEELSRVLVYVGRAPGARHADGTVFDRLQCAPQRLDERGHKASVEQSDHARSRGRHLRQHVAITELLTLAHLKRANVGTKEVTHTRSKQRHQPGACERSASACTRRTRSWRPSAAGGARLSEFRRS